LLRWTTRFSKHQTRQNEEKEENVEPGNGSRCDITIVAVATDTTQQEDYLAACENVY